MPCITIKEAAAICRMEPKNIHTYISRGKLIKRKDNLIDDSHPVNKDFFSKYDDSFVKEIKSNVTNIKETSEDIKSQNETRLIIPINTTVKKEEPKQKKQRSVSKSEEDSDPDYSAFLSVNDLNKLKAEKLEQEIKQLTLKNERLEGELIEVELIKRATYEVINAYRTTLFLAAENVLKNNLIDLGADNDKMTKAVSDLSALFNAGCTNAIEGVKSAFENLV